MRVEACSRFYGILAGRTNGGTGTEGSRGTGRDAVPFSAIVCGRSWPHQRMDRRRVSNERERMLPFSFCGLESAFRAAFLDPAAKEWNENGRQLQSLFPYRR